MKRNPTSELPCFCRRFSPIISPDRLETLIEKKMKKSGSKTSPQLGRHHLPSFTRPVRQPGKLPNYMKSTTSADARRERPKVSTKRRSLRTSPDNSRLHRKDSTNSTNVCLISSKNVTASSRPERVLVRKGTSDVSCGSLQVARATCSSTLKGSEFPDYLELNPGGAGLQGSSGLKVCRYSYCSFNDALFPPLKCFISARRRALKAKRSVKLNCQSPNATPTGGGAEIIGREEPATSNGDQTHCFDEISGDKVSQESVDKARLNTDLLKASDNWDSVGLHNYLESFCSKKTRAPVLVPGPEAAPAVKNDSSSSEGNQTPRTCPQYSNTTMCCNAMDGGETTTSADGTKCNAIKHDKDRVEDECDQLETFNGNEPYPGDSELNSIEDECIIVKELNSRNTAMPETEHKRSTRATVKREKTNQESDDPRHLSPRGIHLLPLEPDPGAEKVSLRHQEVDARKNAEEWMVDYALRQAITKGGTSHRKVAFLVEAFERVVPTSKH